MIRLCLGHYKSNMGRIPLYLSYGTVCIAFCLMLDSMKGQVSKCLYTLS